MPEVAAQPLALPRVTALVGPSGSGKTELAVALALRLARARRAGAEVALADLDVLKPYFRSRETAEELAREGVELIAPAGELAQSDLPVVSPLLRLALSRADGALLLDVGGDPAGARALGSVSDLVAAAPHEVLLVLNRHRPFMDEAASVMGLVEQIAGAALLKVTGVASNTNLGDETTERDVLWGLELAREIAAALGVPLRLLGVSPHLEAALAGRADLPPQVVLRRRMLPAFLGGAVLAPPPPRRRA